MMRFPTSLLLFPQQKGQQEQQQEKEPHHDWHCRHHGRRNLRLWVLFVVFVFGSTPSLALSLNVNNNRDGGSSGSSSSSSFSLSAYQTARARETSVAMDASRLHFQILVVDNNNFHGRIVEGVLERIAEYNGALYTLFPSSSTIDSSYHAPVDAAAPAAAVSICRELGLCPTRSTAHGTSFDLSYLDEYDLIIAMDDEIRSLILRSFPTYEDQLYYAPKCRLLSEFWNLDFCNIHRTKKKKKNQNSNNDIDQDDIGDDNKNSNDTYDYNLLLDILDSDLRERAEPFVEMVKDSSSNLLGAASSGAPSSSVRVALPINTNDEEWPLVEAAIILASAGLTRFCLDTMDAQLDHAFQSLLEQHFCRQEHLQYTFDQADEQLRRGCLTVTGYYSLEQRRNKIEQHMEKLRHAFSSPSSSSTTTK